MALGHSDTALGFLPGFFTFGLYPGEVMVVVKGTSLLLAISWMHVVMWVQGSGLPKKKKSPSASSRVIPDPVHLTPSKWNRLRLLSPER